MCICVHVVHTYEGGMQGQRPMSGFFLDAFPPYLCVSGMCICMWRRQFQVLPPQTPSPLFFQGECLPVIWGSLTQQDSQGSELCILSVEIVGIHHYYMDAGDPNSGPHACPRNVLYWLTYSAASKGFPLVCLLFWDKVSLCSPGWLRMLVPKTLIPIPVLVQTSFCTAIRRAESGVTRQMQKQDMYKMR